MSERTSKVSVTDVDEDELHRLLWNEQRRAVIDELSEAEGAVAVSELAAAIADRGSEWTMDDVTVQLHHVHLPMLDEAGVINYDREAEAVTPFPPLYKLAV